MIILVNNKPLELTFRRNITAILQHPETRGMAVAVNNLVVPKSEWETHILNDGDKITIVRATQGG